MASVLLPAAVYLVGIPTCSWVSHPLSQPSLSSRTRSMECSQGSPRDPCLLTGECNLQREAWPTQTAESYPALGAHEPGRAQGRSTTGTYAAREWGVGRRAVRGSCFVSWREQALRTPSVSQGRDREGHEHAILFPQSPREMQISVTETESGPSLDQDGDT